MENSGGWEISIYAHICMHVRTARTHTHTHKDPYIIWVISVMITILNVNMLAFVEQIT